MAVTPPPPKPSPESGITVALYPNRFPAFDIELQRGYGTTATMIRIARLSQSAKGAALQYQDVLPATTGTTVHYRARHVRDGWNDGPFTRTVSGVAGVLGDTPPDTALEGARRTDTFYLFDGQILANVVQSDGVSILAVSKGLQSGTVNAGVVSTGTWVDGPAVSFPTQYNSAPTVTLFPGAGTRYNEPDVGNWSSTAFSSTVGQTVELDAVSISATGFTPRGRLTQQAGAITDRTDAYGGGLLTTVAESTAQTLANAPAYNDQYEDLYSVGVAVGTTNRTGAVRITVAVDASSVGTASTAWSEQSAETHLFDFTTGNTTGKALFLTQLNTISGVTTTWGHRERFKSLQISGTLTTADVTPKVTPAQVNYQTSTAASIFAPMCPTTSDTIRWVSESRSAST